jgi:hypothetical protein
MAFRKQSLYSRSAKVARSLEWSAGSSVLSIEGGQLTPITMTWVIESAIMKEPRRGTQTLEEVFV